VPDRSTAERNAEIVSLYGEGVPGTESAERYGVTHRTTGLQDLIYPLPEAPTDPPRSHTP